VENQYLTYENPAGRANRRRQYSFLGWSVADTPDVENCRKAVLYILMRSVL